MEQCIAYLNTAQSILSSQILKLNKRAFVRRKRKMSCFKSKCNYNQQQLFNLTLHKHCLTILYTWPTYFRVNDQSGRKREVRTFGIALSIHCLNLLMGGDQYNQN